MTAKATAPIRTTPAASAITVLDIPWVTGGAGFVVGFLLEVPGFAGVGAGVPGGGSSMISGYPKVLASHGTDAVVRNVYRVLPVVGSSDELHRSSQSVMACETYQVCPLSAVV